MKQPKSRQEKMFTMTPSSKAEEVVTRLAELPTETIDALAAVLRETVTGIRGSSYREICYTVLWMSEHPGETPPWLAGMQDQVQTQVRDNDPEAAAIARLQALGLL